jgi:hypothetical protein
MDEERGMNELPEFKVLGRVVGRNSGIAQIRESEHQLLPPPDSMDLRFYVFGFESTAQDIPSGNPTLFDLRRGIVKVETPGNEGPEMDLIAPLSNLPIAR